MTHVKGTFPRFIALDFSRLLEIYGVAPSSLGRLGSLYDTLGDRGHTAVNKSEFATGYQQTVFNTFAKTIVQNTNSHFHDEVCCGPSPRRLVDEGINAAPAPAPVSDERFPYKGPAVPVGDWVDNTVNGNGNGFIRLQEAPAVTPAKSNPTNNINVISLAYIPDGMLVHYQTPFGLGAAPAVKWGKRKNNLTKFTTGYSHTYDRTPACSEVTSITSCNQFFHEISLPNLESSTTYYYQIMAANGTTESDVMSFTTAQKAGDKRSFSVAVVNDMGYMNAKGTHQQLINAAEDGAAFAWHGGDISYADDWFTGIVPCTSEFAVCYNGTSSTYPEGDIDTEYRTPLPAGEIPDAGSPNGGDGGVIYESNWDTWQQWMNNITTKMPYMVLPGNHEAACTEFDVPDSYALTAYLNDDIKNGTSKTSNLTYYSCPPSQRNFTAYQHRFRMPGEETGGAGNFWYSFDYGLAHFVSLDGETDYAYSPLSSFAVDTKGNTSTLPTEFETQATDSGPFGAVNGNVFDNKAYAQWSWLKNDLAKVDRKKTPWVFVMSHRPMYSSYTASFKTHIRNAFEEIMIQYGVDAYFGGHIHWYERMWPIGNNTIDSSSVINKNAYYTNPGVSMTHIVNGMAGQGESHTTIATSEILNSTAVLDQTHFGFGKLTVVSKNEAKWEFIKGDDGSVGDSLTLHKRPGKA
ncbi:acid phosphatase [Penicillium lividum]|nr:acid phosphatase [Penicillium lividum]